MRNVLFRYLEWAPLLALYNKSPTYKPSSGKLSRDVNVPLGACCCALVLFKVLYCDLKIVFFIFVLYVLFV